MKKIAYHIVLGLVVLLTVSSCELFHDINKQDEPEVEYAPTWPLNGEYYVKYGTKAEDGSITYDDAFGYFTLFIYNTSDNVSDQVWVWDDASFWDFKVKCDANPSAKSFGNADEELTNMAYDSKVIVQSGSVLLGAATATGGNASDSLYVEVLFDDDNTPYETTYVLAGYRRTGFLEDEH